MTMTVISTTEQPKTETVAKPDASPKETVVETSEAAAAKAGEQAETSDESETSTEEHEEKLEAAEAAAEEEEEEEAEEGEPAKDLPKKPLKGFKKRIDKLSKRATLAETERDALRLELAQARLAKEPKKIEAALSEPAEKPRPEDYAKHSDYVEALTKFTVKEANTEREKKEKTAHAQTEQQKVFAKYNEGVKAIKERLPDYDEVMDEASDIIAPGHIVSLLFESDNGPELAYQLSKNRADLERIIKLGPVAAARELGRFEAKHISAAPEVKQETKITTAPAPIKPVGSKGSATTTKSIYDADKMTQAEYEALRAKQRAKKSA